MLMKRNFINIIFFFLFITLGYGQGFEFTTGPVATWDIHQRLNFIYEGYNLNHLFGAGLFIDATYARLTTTYIFIPSETTYLVNELLLKLPVFIKNIRLWTGLGLKYFYCLNYKTGEEPVFNLDINDFFLTINVGSEIHLFKDVAVGLALGLAYNLTPNPFTTATTLVFRDVSYCFTFYLGYVI